MLVLILMYLCCRLRGSEVAVAKKDSMESFVQDLGGVELNLGSFLHLENFYKNFLVVGLGNVTTLDSTSRH